MVDFNSDSIVGKAPSEVVNLILIEHWYNWRIAWEDYMRLRGMNANAPLHYCKARLSTLFLSCIEILRRKLIDSKEEFDFVYDISTRSGKATEDEILKSYLIINSVLDSISLIKVDTRKMIDRTRVETTNKEAGY